MHLWAIVGIFGETLSRAVFEQLLIILLAIVVVSTFSYHKQWMLGLKRV